MSEINLPFRLAWYRILPSPALSPHHSLLIYSYGHTSHFSLYNFSLFFFFTFSLRFCSIKHFYSCNPGFLAIEDIVQRLIGAKIDQISYTHSDLSDSFAGSPA